MVYVRCAKRIQLSRSSRPGCYVVSAGIMHAQTASSAEGVSSCKNWMLSLTKVEVRRGVDLPKPPPERGGACRSQTSDPALLYFMRFQASAEM